MPRPFKIAPWAALAVFALVQAFGFVSASRSWLAFGLVVLWSVLGLYACAQVMKVLALRRVGRRLLAQAGR